MIRTKATKPASQSMIGTTSFTFDESQLKQCTFYDMPICPPSKTVGFNTLPASKVPIELTTFGTTPRLDPNILKRTEPRLQSFPSEGNIQRCGNDFESEILQSPSSQNRKRKQSLDEPFPGYIGFEGAAAEKEGSRFPLERVGDYMLEDEDFNNAVSLLFRTDTDKSPEFLNQNIQQTGSSAQKIETNNIASMLIKRSDHHPDQLKSSKDKFHSNIHTTGFRVLRSTADSPPVATVIQYQSYPMSLDRPKQVPERDGYSRLQTVIASEKSPEVFQPRPLPLPPKLPSSLQQSNPRKPLGEDSDSSSW